METDEIISLYQAVSDLMDQMLVAVGEEQWERFSTLELRCANQVQRIRNAGPAHNLPDTVRARKMQIIHHILARDRAIRDIAHPWMAQLSLMLNSAGAEHKLSRAYGAAQGN